MQSRLVKEVSPTTIRYYKVKLGRYVNEVNYHNATQQQIEKFLLQFTNPGNRHGYYQAIKTFYYWLEQIYGIPSPINHLPAPKVGKLILPSLNEEQVKVLINSVDNVRDRAIISLFTESGLRLSELAGIRLKDIDWDNHLVKVLGKGRKEAYAPFGELSGQYLKDWISQRNPNGGNIWGLNEWGHFINA